MKLCLLLLAVLWAPFVAYGVDPTGTLVGLVTDPSGAVIANAPVTVRNQATNIARTLTTSMSGEYSAPLLPPAGPDPPVPDELAAEPPVPGSGLPAFPAVGSVMTSVPPAPTSLPPSPPDPAEPLPMS